MFHDVEIEWLGRVRTGWRSWVEAYGALEVFSFSFLLPNFAIRSNSSFQFGLLSVVRSHVKICRDYGVQRSWMLVCIFETCMVWYNF